ncbi:MAG: maleylpyruvate isomerase family mycothiol-dependent enzyme [Streptosporangiaceae bacterium]
METDARRWIEALRNSQNRLAVVLGPLGPDQLTGPSYDTDWTIAQVLSHLGSQAEIFQLFLDAALAGEQAPGSEVFGPIWDTWNAKPPILQAADGLQAGEDQVVWLEARTDGDLALMRLDLFGMDLDAAGLARMRLAEHAVHTWDVAVALDSAAVISADAVALLVDTADQLLGRLARPQGVDLSVQVTTHRPERVFHLVVTGESVTLGPWDSGTVEAELELPAEAFLRLVYGRLDPAHTPEGIKGELGPLRRLFPGF